MNRVNLVVLWHMHQPQYRDPESGRYVLPWTRLHATKDYFGMVKMLEEFPEFHATFNVVPALGMQLEEYASGKFNEPWFALAFKDAGELTREDKQEILARAFQVNHERLMSRWKRFVELYEWSRPAHGAQALVAFTARDWRDLQLLSQLAWMEESWLEKDEVVSRLASQGRDFTERDKEALKAKIIELIRMVLPVYREAAQRGQIELSTTPFYHPILPLVCDSDIARVASPATPLPRRAFRRPEDAREQLRRAREYHERVFGMKPAGLWPSEGSVSDQALAIAAEEGFRWFGTDEGVLGRTLNVGFFRDSTGIPSNAERLYKPWRVQSANWRDYWIISRSPFVGLDRVCIQQDGFEGRGEGFARATEVSRRTGARITAADYVHFSGRRKRVGILSGKRAGIFAGILSSHRERSGFPRADGLGSDRGRGRRADDRWNFSSFVDQCEFRCVDWKPGGCGGLGIVVGCEGNIRASSGAEQRRTQRMRQWRRG